MASNNTPQQPNRPGPTASPSQTPGSHLPHLRPPSLLQSQSPPFPSSLFSTPPSHLAPTPQPHNQSPFQINMGVGSGQNPKRPPQKPPTSALRPNMPGHMGGNPSMSPGLFRSSADLTPAARRKKRKLPEKQIPDRVAALLPESALYTQLLEFEARVDSALARKKIDIQEALKSPPSMQKTLRIYVFNTFANQTRNGPPSKTPEPPSWSLKIIGRILDDPTEPDPAGGIPKQNPIYPKFSTFFKRVSIALDQGLYPDNPMIIWENARSAAPHEGFEVKRKGDKEFTANIRFDMNYMPERFKLSPPLVEVLGIEVDTRARVIAGLWQYVKAKKLQNPNDPSFFMCDPPLRRIFGEEKMKFAMVSQKISQHLSSPMPITIEHRVRLTGNGLVGNTCYDITVDVPFPLQKEMAAFLANIEKHKDIESCDEVICASIKKIHKHRKRRAFFLGFSQSPVEFVNSLIASQSRDLKIVAGDANRNAEKERRADFYNQPWVEDAVIRYLNRKPSGVNEAPNANS
ncbi:hypothetical protein LUZ61_001002 [Rhynchospora tenuis]|uniref:DM2 domain-containing protein n=1 Tax=Rhynchospora tenuis TaxID=198213 RepID=A0AAD5ZG37_9POAL|nr:hypothetical protein LUZ61_001002 [Rhynchospora tenuis]